MFLVLRKGSGDSTDIKDKTATSLKSWFVRESSLGVVVKAKVYSAIAGFMWMTEWNNP